MTNEERLAINVVQAEGKDEARELLLDRAAKADSQHERAYFLLMADGVMPLVEAFQAKLPGLSTDQAIMLLTSSLAAVLANSIRALIARDSESIATSIVEEGTLAERITYDMLREAAVILRATNTTL